MIIAFIIACEIGFWVFVLGGLSCRYLLNKRKSGNILLLCTPLVDLALLVATVISLQNGGVATFAHALAAVYIGVSIGFGHRMIKWADERFAYWFAKGEKPEKKVGKEHAREERRGFIAHLISWAIGSLLLYSMIVWIHDAARTEALLKTISIWSLVLAIDFVISMSYTIWPRKAKGTDNNTTSLNK